MPRRSPRPVALSIPSGSFRRHQVHIPAPPPPSAHSTLTFLLSSSFRLHPLRSLGSLRPVPFPPTLQPLSPRHLRSGRVTLQVVLLTNLRPYASPQLTGVGHVAYHRRGSHERPQRKARTELSIVSMPLRPVRNLQLPFVWCWLHDSAAARQADR